MSRTEEEALLFGRKPAAPPAMLWQEAAEAVEVVVRLWDSWEDDAVIRDLAHRPLRRPRPPALHRLRRRVLLREGPLDHAAQPAGPPARRAVRDEPEALPVVARWADVVRVAAPDLAAAHTRAGTGARGRSRAPGATPTRSPCSSTSPGPTGRDAASQAVRGGAADGVTPAAGGPDLPASSDGCDRSCGLRRPCAGSATLRERFGLLPPGQLLRGGPPVTQPTRSRSTSPRTSRASTTPRSGATRRRAARPTSPRSCTSPARPSAASSTSCSSPRACGCASTAAASTTWTWSAGRTRSPCSTRSPPSPPTSGSAARSTPRSTSRTSWPASSPRSTTSPAGAPRGTSSPARTRSPARTSAAAAS